MPSMERVPRRDRTRSLFVASAARKPVTSPISVLLSVLVL